MSDPVTLSDSYFLSYSRSDEAVALRFATDLRDRGVAMWVDQFDIRPSEHWDRAIERAVHQCRGLVVILSPRSVESDNVADEISFAIDHQKSVLPVMIERCRPPLRITRMQVIDAIGCYERALEQCVRVLGGADPLPVPPIAPAPAAKGVTDVEAIAAAKARLTDILGPIASILVDRESARANSVEELHGLLAGHIDDESDRQRFMAAMGGAAPNYSAPKPTAQSSPVGQIEVANGEIDRLEAILTPYLGPIARAVIRREGAGAASAEDLHQRLASLIPNERERSDFLRQARAR